MVESGNSRWPRGRLQTLFGSGAAGSSVREETLAASAARTAHGRAAVDVLLKDMENLEQRWDGGATFDFSELRRQLRLEWRHRVHVVRRMERRRGLR